VARATLQAACMSGFTVRRDGAEEAVRDAPSLLRMAQDGALRRDDEVREGDGDWIPAHRHPQVRTAWARDPWAAWADSEGVDASSVYRALVRDVVPELPADAVQPARDEPEPLPIDAVDALPGEPETLPDEAWVGTEAPPSAAARARQPAPFVPASPPAASGEGSAGSRPRRERAALPPEVEALLTRRNIAEDRPRRTGARVFSFGMAGVALAAALWLALYAPEAGSMATVPAAGPGPAGETVATGPAAPATPAGPGTALRPVEAALRAALPSEPRDVQTATQLIDAITLDLAQMQVRVVSVDAKVVRFTGRKLDRPRSVEVRVRLLGGEDAARDLGAVALVVGRYARLYRLDLPVFVVTDAAGRARSLRGDDVDALYLGRLDLGAFVAAAGG
jgi:hypothetical protein